MGKYLTTFFRNVSKKLVCSFIYIYHNENEFQTIATKNEVIKFIKTAVYLDISVKDQTEGTVTAFELLRQIIIDHLTSMFTYNAILR